MVALGRINPLGCAPLCAQKVKNKAECCVFEFRLLDSREMLFLVLEGHGIDWGVVSTSERW